MDLLNSGKNSADQNMQIDQQLLANLTPKSLPILRFYDWSHPSATFGYFSSPAALLNIDAVETYGLQLARRPTGGGIIFHEFDFTFSFLLPASHRLFSVNTLENYRLVNHIVAGAIGQFLSIESPLNLLCCQKNESKSLLSHFCMAKPTVYDVVHAGRKLAGAAQRRTKEGFLHQGSISLVLPPDSFLESIFSHNLAISEAMKRCSFPLLGKECTEDQKIKAKEILQQLLTEEFLKTFRC